MKNDSELIIEAAGTELPMIEADFRERFEQKCTYPSLEITYLAVSRKYQNLKIGSTLIDFIANIARNQKVSGCVFLTVNALHTGIIVPYLFMKRIICEMNINNTSNIW